MVTVTLHDADAAEVLRLLHETRREPNDLSISKSMTIFRAEEAFKCALALCDCGQTTGKV